MTSPRLSRRCGALGLSDGRVRWRLWAPKANRVELIINGDPSYSAAMEPEARGYFSVTQSGVGPDTAYAYRLDGSEERPDPCSLWQPEGVHGHSVIVRPEKFRFTDKAWGGVSRKELIIYELHVGTFTPEGTFDAIIGRLPALRDLGITALELMPVAQFPGTRDWGYDGVFPYAAQNTYGGPAALAHLVDACHAQGLAILLDVVYNHLGPEGNYLREFGPYFTDRYKTPWGEAFNYDGPGSDAVRDFVLDNARMWLEDFHFDGLRLDAVHAIFDFSARHILGAIKKIADQVAVRSARTIHIIAESDLNDPRVLLRPEQGGYGLDAQWADDFHHAVHAYLTGERRGYYDDFGDISQVGRALQSPFVYASDYSRHRDRRHGALLPPGLGGDRFVVCLQNHDQVGNRAQGERLRTLLHSPPRLRLAASLLMFSPYIPLLFMGEEYGEEKPFPFFCSFSDEQLIQAVREGRTRDFPDFACEALLDPQAESTFDTAKLRWSWPEGTFGAALRRLHADLIAARNKWPALCDSDRCVVNWMPDESMGPILHMIRGHQASTLSDTLDVYFNLSDTVQGLSTSSDENAHAPLFSSESALYQGRRTADDSIRKLHPFECLAFGPVSWKDSREP
jgi:maltooligosyltrehalose trehalohydrolase